MARNVLTAITLSLLLAVAGLAAGPAWSTRVTAPKPAIAPVAWELNFRFYDPQRLSVVLPGRTEPVLYWYMLYSVENPTAHEVDFYPRFELVTDTLQVLPSEVGVSPEAFRAAQRRSGNPLLVAPHDVVGRLLRGKDRRKHSVAIWRDFDPKAKAFTIYVSGLSGEVARWKNPAFDHARPESETNQRYFVLRKTLAVPYRFPGDQSERTRAVPQRETREQNWVMR
jgi:hypothetical protein